MTEAVEEWRAVPGWPYYEVSDHGRVRSVDRAFVDAIGRRRSHRGQLLTPILRQDGHYDVHMRHQGLCRIMRVHVLVLEAFVGPRPPGMECLHSNDVGTDNRLSNLRWGTHSENLNDLVRNGRHYWAQKTHCVRGHLLAAPNLVASAVKLGRRACRSCSAARAAGQGQKSSIPPFDVQAVADKYYELWTPPGAAA